ncbi:hypothetical protein [Luteimonas rhizosphaerae]|nr:hypothetical protein [Luteimonas sp. 4-12]
MLAEMARVVRVAQPGADWHEVEPGLRRLWNAAPRGVHWNSVRSVAANHWLFGGELPTPAQVILPTARRDSEAPPHFVPSQRRDDDFPNGAGQWRG